MAKKIAARKPRAPALAKPRSKPQPVAFVYVLGGWRSGAKLSYVGWTVDVQARLKRHNGGTGAKSTRGRNWTLLHVEPFRSKQLAMSREWHLKRDRKWRKALLSAWPG